MCLLQLGSILLEHLFGSLYQRFIWARGLNHGTQSKWRRTFVSTCSHSHSLIMSQSRVLRWEWKPVPSSCVPLTDALHWLPSILTTWSTPSQSPVSRVSVLLALCTFSHSMGGPHVSCDLWITSRLTRNLLSFFSFMVYTIIFFVILYWFFSFVYLLYLSPRE